MQVFDIPQFYRYQSAAFDILFCKINCYKIIMIELSTFRTGIPKVFRFKTLDTQAL